MDSLKVGLNLACFRARVPNMMPVLCRFRRCSCTNDVEDVFRTNRVSENEVELRYYSRVLARATRPAVVLLKVIDESSRIVTKITEIDCLTTRAEEEQSVEDLEKFCGRLMYTSRGTPSANNSAPLQDNNVRA